MEHLGECGSGLVGAAVEIDEETRHLGLPAGRDCRGCEVGLCPGVVIGLVVADERSPLGEGGTLFGYYETDDDAAAQAHLAASPIAARWEAEMSRFFVDLDGRPDQAATPLSEVFHLEDQLAAAGGSPASDIDDEGSTP